ncbi:FUSC family protein [Flavobacterium sp. AG291]|uniref:FUSC family protein n=1 Tax=Flavobacterium sp. AG291 TaxID=2184000 RepID=UPI000E0B9F40|nr:FUSC family protein [Flavobacterium sp. AG291]RDI05333.1 fusaric acid resistance family protein [Flavobacterium sp. AG291]
MGAIRTKKRIIVAKREAKNVIQLNDKPWRWVVGTEAALTMAVPLLFFTLIGHQQLGFIASLGGLTALHSPQLTRMERAVVLPMVAVCITLSALLGSLMGHDIWLRGLCIVMVTLLGSVFMVGYKLGPPGTLMLVLVTAVSGKIASSGTFEWYVIPELVGLGSIVAYCIVIVPIFFTYIRWGVVHPPKWSVHFSGIHFDSVAKAITIRIVVGVIIAVVVACVFKEQRSYWIVLPVIAVLQASHSRRLTVIKAIHRVGGSLLGVILFGIILYVNPQGLWLVLVIAVLQFAIEVVVMKHYGLALMFITPMALTIALAGGETNVADTVQSRIIDTMIGVAIALVVFFIFEKTRFKTE